MPQQKSCDIIDLWQYFCHCSVFTLSLIAFARQSMLQGKKVLAKLGKMNVYGLFLFNSAFKHLFSVVSDFYKWWGDGNQ